MPEMILGLDIGVDSIKAVLATGGRASFRVLASEIVQLEGGVELEEALKKIAGAVRSLATSRIRCIVSLPPSDVMFRQIHLPFRDEGKIKKTLSFELEPLLPLPIEEVVIDYLHLPEEGLLAAAVGKKRIRKIIAAVEAHLGKVSVVDIATAVLALPLLEQKAFTGAGMVLDIGASSTFAVFYEKNALVQIRSFAFGGNTITDALARDLSCDSQEAERVKISAGDPVGTGEAVSVCREFCVALANTVEFMRINETLHGEPAQLTITGGGSLYKPLSDELEKTFGLPTTAWGSERSGRTEINQPPDMDVALAAVKRASAAGKSFNFRQGEFAPRSVPGDLKKRLQWGAVIAGIILLLAGVDLFLDYQGQERQADSLKKQISLIFKKHYSPSAVMVDPVRQLQTKLAEDKKAYGIADGGSGITVLELLKDVSGFISPALDVVITHLHYENRVVLLKGEAKKIDDVTSVKNELEKSKYFKAVTIGSTSLGKEGAKVNFDLRIELK